MHRGKGCEQCRHTGYKGRRALYEILEIDHDLRDMIAEHAAADVIIEAARTMGFKTLVEDAKRKGFDGVTTPEEVFRVLSSYEDS